MNYRKGSEDISPSVLLIIRPAQPRTRFEQDIGFSHIHLKADFAGFVKQVIDVPEAFDEVAIGLSWSCKSDREEEKIKQGSGGGCRGGSSYSKADTMYE